MPVSREALSREVAKRTGLSIVGCEEVLACLLVEITCHLRDGGTIHLRDFGTFKRKWRKGHPVRNPRTNELLKTTDDHWAVVFVPHGWKYQLPYPRITR